MFAIVERPAGQEAVRVRAVYLSLRDAFRAASKADYPLMVVSGWLSAGAVMTARAARRLSILGTK